LIVLQQPQAQLGSSQGQHPQQVQVLVFMS
jgi:hypothetical protein